jgi:hypothetical protein
MAEDNRPVKRIKIESLSDVERLTTHEIDNMNAESLRHLLKHFFYIPNSLGTMLLDKLLASTANTDENIKPFFEACFQVDFNT